MYVIYLMVVCKRQKKYYEDCAILLRKIILQQLNLKLYLSKLIYIKKIQGYKNFQIPYESSTNNEKPEELRSVVTIFRHAELSPESNVIDGLIVTGGTGKTVSTIHSGRATLGFTLKL